MAHGNTCDPIEDALLTRCLGQQHHADKKEIDVQTFADGMHRACDRQKPREHKQKRTAADPPCLRDTTRTEEHKQNAAEREYPDEGDGEMRQRGSCSSVTVPAECFRSSDALEKR